MEIMNEKINYDNPFLYLKIYKSHRKDKSAGRWHYHKELEILVILDGTIDLFTKENIYHLEKGDVVLLGSSELHTDQTLGNLNYIVFQFDIEQFFDSTTMPYIQYFSETTHPLSRLNYIFQENEQIKKNIFQSVNDIYDEFVQKEEGYEIAVTILIKKILLLLLRGDSRKLLNHQDRADMVRLKPALDYIEEHIGERMAITEVCKTVNISYYYFVKMFKKIMGMSFTEYVNYKKIKRAERLLLTRDISILDIGERIGMTNMAHFYKLFKKFNACSPNQFRKKMQSWSAEASKQAANPQ